MNRYFEKDIDPTPILDRRVTVVGYGNQGRAHALNMRDSGLKVQVGSREGKGRNLAVEDGFEPQPLAEAVQQADMIVLTVPDETMSQVFEDHIQSNMQDEATLVFAHGFALTYGLVEPRAGGAVLVSPSGPGTAVRLSYTQGEGVPAFFAAEPQSNRGLALAYGWAIGSARAGLLETTFQEETECDLFGEQVVLCGGMPELAIAAFETLVDSGYSPEVAYTECVQQVRLLAELMALYGVAGMKQRISDTAEWGAYLNGPKLIDDSVRERMGLILRSIQNKSFAMGWMEEASKGKQRLAKFRDEAAGSLNEDVFRKLTVRPDRHGPSGDRV